MFRKLVEEKKYYENPLKRGLKKALATFSGSLGKSKSLTSEVAKYYQLIMDAKNDVSVYELALKMLQKGPPALRICVSAHMLANEQLLVLVEKHHFSFKSLEEFAKGKEGQDYIKRAINCVEYMLTDDHKPRGPRKSTI